MVWYSHLFENSPVCWIPWSKVLSKDTRDFPIAETGYTFSVLNATPFLLCFHKIHCFGFLPASLVSCQPPLR